MFSIYVQLQPIHILLSQDGCPTFPRGKTYAVSECLKASNCSL